MLLDPENERKASPSTMILHSERKQRTRKKMNRQTSGNDSWTSLQKAHNNSRKKVDGECTLRLVLRMFYKRGSAFGVLTNSPKMALKLRWLVAVALAVLPSLGDALMPAKTQTLFDEPYRPNDSRHFTVQKSTTFNPEAAKQFDLSYADGTELKGFAGHDVVHVRSCFIFSICHDCPDEHDPKIT